MSTKTCTKCGEVKPATLEHFYRQGAALSPRCRPCKRALAGAQYRANPERVKETGRRWKAANPERAWHLNWKSQLKQKYNLTPEAYAAMLKAQGGTCAICRQPSNARVFCVDHCHTTGRVRGLLCGPCNGFLGRIQDSTEALDRVKEYLHART